MESQALAVMFAAVTIAIVRMITLVWRHPEGCALKTTALSRSVCGGSRFRVSPPKGASYPSLVARHNPTPPTTTNPTSASVSTAAHPHATCSAGTRAADPNLSLIHI